MTARSIAPNASRIGHFIDFKLSFEPFYLYSVLRLKVARVATIIVTLTCEPISEWRLCLSRIYESEKAD